LTTSHSGAEKSKQTLMSSVSNTSPQELEKVELLKKVSSYLEQIKFLRNKVKIKLSQKHFVVIPPPFIFPLKIKSSISIQFLSDKLHN
jgi:hypothetical protein